MDDTGDRTRAGMRWVSVAGPLLLALFQVVGTVGASQRQPDRRDLDAVAIVLVLAGPAALLFLRRFPVQVLWFVSAVTLGYLLAGYPYETVVLSLVVAVLGAVVLGHRSLAARSPSAPPSWPTSRCATCSATSRGRGASSSPSAHRHCWCLSPVNRARAPGAGQTARRIRAETQRRQASEERLRIARELHDVVAHHMSLINVQAGVALHLVDRKPEQVETALAAIKDASKEALVELRALIGVLRDDDEAAPRAPAPASTALDDLVERSPARRARRVDARVERRHPAAARRGRARGLPDRPGGGHQRRAALRRAARADVGVGYAAGRLAVDSRRRRHAARRRTRRRCTEGSGIRGMRERAAALGGTLDLGAVAARRHAGRGRRLPAAATA